MSKDRAVHLPPPQKKNISIWPERTQTVVSCLTLPYHAVPCFPGNACSLTNCLSYLSSPSVSCTISNPDFSRRIAPCLSAVGVHGPAGLKAVCPPRRVTQHVAPFSTGYRVTRRYRPRRTDQPAQPEAVIDTQYNSVNRRSDRADVSANVGRDRQMDGASLTWFDVIFPISIVPLASRAPCLCILHVPFAFFASPFLSSPYSRFSHALPLLMGLCLFQPVYAAPSSPPSPPLL